MAEISTNSTRGNKNVRRKRSSLRIDMTPMVDLAFLLITFFMLTTALTKPLVMEVNKPEDDTSNTDSRQTIREKDLLTLVLGENDKLYWFIGQTAPEINVTDYSEVGVRKVLTTKKAEIQRLHVFIKGSKGSRYKNLVDIMDEMLITEIKNYSIVDMTRDDDKLIAEFKMKESGLRIN